jgi:uncharacterized protein YrrD
VSAPERPQVSWKAIAGDAVVVAADGTEVGKVSKIVGDTDADIFTGLAVKRHALADEQLVEAERVRAIWEDRVELDLSPEAVEALPTYEDEPVVRVRPDEHRGFFRRLFGR